MGCRRPLLCRLFRRPRRAAARPLPSRGHGGGACAARPRHAFRRQPRARNRMGRAGQGADPDRRAGAVHLVRHRGDLDGGAPRARLYRQAEADPLQLSFPRLARPHDVGPHEPFRRHADDRRARRGGRQRAAVRPERRGGAGAAARTARGRDRRRDHRADRRQWRQTADRPGFPARAAPADRRARRAA